VLAYDPLVHGTGMYAADGGKLPAKPPGVERCAGADHIDHASRPAPRYVLGENIERTRGHERDARKSTSTCPATSSQIARFARARSRRV
jgi:hypothetical protein